MPPNPPRKSFLRRDMFGVGEHIPKIRELDVAKVRPNPDQPRQTFDDGAIADLAQSIRDKGLLQPIVVKLAPDAETFIIAAGERRYRAIQKLEWNTLPAVVTEGDIEEIALIENMQREALQPLEEARAVERLMRTHNYALEEVARVLGKSKSSVSELLSIVKLPANILNDIATSPKIPSKSVLIELAKIPDDEQQEKWQALKSGTIGFSHLKAAKRDRNTEPKSNHRSNLTIREIAKYLYIFSSKAELHSGDVSEDDIEYIRAAKNQADTKYNFLISKK